MINKREILFVLSKYYFIGDISFETRSSIRFLHNILCFSLSIQIMRILSKNSCEPIEFLRVRNEIRIPTLAFPVSYHLWWLYTNNTCEIWFISNVQCINRYLYFFQNTLQPLHEFYYSSKHTNESNIPIFHRNILLIRPITHLWL